MIEQPAAVLEDRHVAADLAEAAEGDDAQAVLGSCGGGAELGVRMTHRAPSLRSVRRFARTLVPMVSLAALAHRTPALGRGRRAAASTSASVGGHERAGAAVPVGEDALQLQRGLGVMTPWVRNMTR